MQFLLKNRLISHINHPSAKQALLCTLRQQRRPLVSVLPDVSSEENLAKLQEMSSGPQQVPPIYPHPNKLAVLARSLCVMLTKIAPSQLAQRPKQC